MKNPRDCFRMFVSLNEYPPLQRTKYSNTGDSQRHNRFHRACIQAPQFLGRIHAGSSLSLPIFVESSNAVSIVSLAFRIGSAALCHSLLITGPSRPSISFPVPIIVCQYATEKRDCQAIVLLPTSRVLLH
jgi:hypothetical protein